MLPGELRSHMDLTQAELAERLGVVQSSVAKAEGAANPRVGTLRSLVEGLGGEMAIVVQLPGEEPIRLELRTDMPRSSARPRRRAMAG